MNRLILISVVYMQFGWSCGAPKPEGLGVYAYQDSSGNRYGGTYDLSDDQLKQGHFNPMPFGPSFDDFFPEYFRNFENLLQEAFKTNKEIRTRALESAKKAYDITSNQASFMNFDFSRFSPFNGPNGGFGGFDMSNFGFRDAQNMAVASGVAMPGVSHQIAAISPPNPNQPNVDVVNRFPEVNPKGSDYVSVSSHSYATSTNVDGKQQSHRGAETTVNNNGVVHHYKVEE